MRMMQEKCKGRKKNNARAKDKHITVAQTRHHGEEHTDVRTVRKHKYTHGYMKYRNKAFCSLRRR